MKRGRIASILGTVAVAGFSMAAYAEVNENPYQIIIDRNPFGLRPPPPPPEPKKEEPPPVPAPEVKLTGITTLLGPARVMLQVEDKQTKKFSFPTIAEGDSDSATGIAVLSIDIENQRVRIKNGEAETTLDFKNNGIKPGGGAVASAAPVPHPGVVPPLATPLGIPAPAVPNNPANPTTGRGAIVGGGASQPTAALPGGLPNTLAGGGLPPRPLRTDGLSIMAGGGGQVYNPNPLPVTAQPSMTREEAEARIEAQRRILQQQQASGQSVPYSPNILPPTSMGRALGNPTP